MPESWNDTNQPVPGGEEVHAEDFGAVRHEFGHAQVTKLEDSVEYVPLHGADISFLATLVDHGAEVGLSKLGLSGCLAPAGQHERGVRRVWRGRPPIGVTRRAKGVKTRAE